MVTQGKQIHDKRFLEEVLKRVCVISALKLVDPRGKKSIRLIDDSLLIRFKSIN